MPEFLASSFLPYQGISTAGSRTSGHLMRCLASASESQCRLAFIKTSGVAVVTAAIIPLVSTAAEVPEEPIVKVGEEIISESGLKYVITKVGTGTKPNPGDSIKAHYTGELTSAVYRKEPDCDMCMQRSSNYYRNVSCYTYVVFETRLPLPKRSEMLPWTMSPNIEPDISRLYVICAHKVLSCWGERPVCTQVPELEVFCDRCNCRIFDRIEWRSMMVRIIHH